jgi:hypothetical protein
MQQDRRDHAKEKRQCKSDRRVGQGLADRGIE